MSPRPTRTEMVADATLVSVAAVRQAVKNLMLVRALRDAADFEHDWYADAVRRELEVLAAEAEAEAIRLRTLRDRAVRRRGPALSAEDYRAADTRRLRKRARVLDEMAAELRRMAENDDAVAGLITEARTRALDEIAATAASVPGRGRSKPAKGVARSRALQALREELSDYA